MNDNTTAVMRVVIENFDMTAQEMERLWAEQDEYINLLESQVRQSEEKVQMFRFKMIQNRLEVVRKNEEIAKHSFSRDNIDTGVPNKLITRKSKPLILSIY